MRSHARSDRGAAAVEFALILPVFVLLIVGMIEFSRAYNAQISISNAAREAARYMAIHDNLVDAKEAAVAVAALNPNLTVADVEISPADCSAGETVEVVITYELSLLTTIAVEGPTLSLSGRGGMICGG